MMNANEIEVEAPVFAAEDTRYDNDDATLGDEPQEDNESMVNDESVNDIVAPSSSSRFARGFSNLSSSVKWSVIAFGTVAVALAIGLGSGYGIGDKLYSPKASTVSSAALAATDADYATYDVDAYSNDYPAGSKSGKSTKKGFSTIYFSENLNHGDERIIYESGPFTVRVGCSGRQNGQNPQAQSFCDNRRPCIQLTAYNEFEDMLVFGVRKRNNGGDGSFSQVLPKDTEASELIWQPENPPQNNANDPGVGGVWANEYYVGLNGESIIQTREADGLEIIGGDCQIAGVLNVYSPRHHSSKSAKGYF